MILTSTCNSRGCDIFIYFSLIVYDVNLRKQINRVSHIKVTLPKIPYGLFNSLISRIELIIQYVGWLSLIYDNEVCRT
jgi:hypothetical protein